MFRCHFMNFTNSLFIPYMNVQSEGCITDRKLIHCTWLGISHSKHIGVLHREMMGIFQTLHGVSLRGQEQSMVLNIPRGGHDERDLLRNWSSAGGSVMLLAGSTMLHPHPVYIAPPAKGGVNTTLVLRVQIQTESTNCQNRSDQSNPQDPKTVLKWIKRIKMNYETLLWGSDYFWDTHRANILDLDEQINHI